jgi:hypothetical protein
VALAALPDDAVPALEVSFWDERLEGTFVKQFDYLLGCQSLEGHHG